MEGSSRKGLRYEVSMQKALAGFRRRSWLSTPASGVAWRLRRT